MPATGWESTAEDPVELPWKAETRFYTLLFCRLKDPIDWPVGAPVVTW